VQLYVGDPDAAVARPVRELKGFQKLDLAPAQTATATFQLSARDLSYWSTTHGGWHLEPGSFDLAVGASSRDLRLTTTIDVTAPPARIRLDAMSTLEEWLADPVGGPELRAAIGTEPDGRPAGILGNDELIRIIGNFPISSLAAFPGLGITHQTVDTLTAGRKEPS
jgi:beta-glucosidase